MMSREEFLDRVFNNKEFPIDFLRGIKNGEVTDYLWNNYPWILFVFIVEMSSDVIILDFNIKECPDYYFRAVRTFRPQEKVKVFKYDAESLVRFVSCSAADYYEKVYGKSLE